MIHTGNQVYIGDSSEAKPAVASGARFVEQNTQTDYLYNGSTWINMGNISGANVKEYGTSVLIGSQVSITSLSGGTELGSGVTFGFAVRNISGNSPMYLGGATGVNVPASGKGMILYGGDSEEFRLANLNAVHVFASTSGQFVTYLGVV